jgi:hypothetical protein
LSSLPSHFSFLSSSSCPSFSLLVFPASMYQLVLAIKYILISQAHLNAVPYLSCSALY